VSEVTCDYSYQAVPFTRYVVKIDPKTHKPCIVKVTCAGHLVAAGRCRRGRACSSGT